MRVEIVEINFIVGISGPLPARRWCRRRGRWRRRCRVRFDAHQGNFNSFPSKKWKEKAGIRRSFRIEKRIMLANFGTAITGTSFGLSKMNDNRSFSLIFPSSLILPWLPSLLLLSLLLSTSNLTQESHIPPAFPSTIRVCRIRKIIH